MNLADHRRQMQLLNERDAEIKRLRSALERIRDHGLKVSTKQGRWCSRCNRYITDITIGHSDDNVAPGSQFCSAECAAECAGASLGNTPRGARQPPCDCPEGAAGSHEPDCNRGVR